MSEATSAKNISRSVKWVALVKLISQLATFATTVFALRFLSQEEYGLASMAFIFMGILDTVIDFGFGAALIQREELSGEECSSVFWLLAALSLGFIALAWPGAHLAGWLFDEYRVVEIIQVLSLAFLATPVQIVYRARLTRVLRLDVLAKCDFLGLVVRSAVTLAGAALGWGLWCLVAGFIAEKIVVALAIVLVDRWLPVLHFQMQSIRTLVHFGLKITGDRIVYFLLYRMDAILVGKFLGTEALGLYTYAQQFVGAILQIIMTTGVKIAYPLFSRHQKSPELLPILYGAERLVALASFPALIGMALIAHDLVQVTVGSDWSRSALYIQVLAVAGLFQMMAALLPQLLNAVDRTGVNLILNSTSALLYFALLGAAMVLFGETGFLVTIIGSQILRYVLIVAVSMSILPIRLNLVARGWLEIALPTACMLAAVLAAQAALTLSHPLLRIGFHIAVAAAAYGAANLLFFRHETVRVYRLLRQP